MDLLLNSSLHNWIFFEQTIRNNVSIPPCQYVNWTTPNADEPRHNLSLPIITNASCTQVCNDSRSLFARQDNLATCGLWSTLVYAYNFYESGPDPNRYVESAPVDLLSSFANVGLDAHAPEYFQSTVGYADVISACFVLLDQDVKAWKSADDGSVSGACTKNGLFPYLPGSNNLIMSNSSGDAYTLISAGTLDSCLADICSPVPLNPELAGIGFLISFVLQSAIAITAFAILLGLESWHRSIKVTLAAIISFHKAQCYFSSIVQIAAIFFLYGVLGDTNTTFIDTSALVVLATSGFIPVTFGLASITRFGRPSWHLLMLSLITFALATANLSIFYSYVINDLTYFKLDNYYESLDDGTMRGSAGDIFFPLCGSSLLDNNALSLNTITDWWIWIAWGICMAWMLLCFYCKLVDEFPPERVRSKLESALTRHPWMKMLLCFYSTLMDELPPKTVRTKLDSALNRHPWMKLPKKIMGRSNGRMLIFIVTSTLCFDVCFGVQIYLIIVFTQHHLVSQVWSFGQIIAVTVWLPSIFEYFNDIDSSRMDSLEPKSPSPLGIMRDIVQQTVAMGNYRPIGRSNDAAISSSDIEAVPLQQLSSVVDSHGTGQEDQQ